jgi:hypothetical protein
MAAGSISEPGSIFGPCKEECTHPDCLATKTMAASWCAICFKEIGYNTRFYQQQGRETVYVHALCLEKAIAKQADVVRSGE